DFAALRDAAGTRHVAESGAGPPPPEDLDPSEDEEDDDPEPARIQTAWQRCGAAFTELLGELTESESREYRRRLMGRRVDELRPRDPAAARATLRSIVEKAVTRLEAKLEVHEAHAALEAAAVVDRLAFDESAEG